MSPVKILVLIWKLPRSIIKWMVKFYQAAISPLLGRNCKFHPSCSKYMLQAIDKYGAVKGTLKGLGRICRCHPWSNGGEDYP